MARGEELGLEGVVAKRLSSTYIPGRRRTAWVKHKLRREERLAMTVVAATSDAVAKAVSWRALPGGSLVGESTGQELRGVGYG
ncbi:MAG: hypothetical protein ACXVHB_28980 [Solirubrobacteraceae bacterium]